MKITKPGRYKLLGDLYSRGSFNSITLKYGSIVTITKVDSNLHQILGPELLDWHYWDIKAEFVGNIEPAREKDSIPDWYRITL